MAEARRRRETAVRQVIVMVKAPRPGRVKTRLAKRIGDVRAVWLYRHLTAAIIRRLARSASFGLVLAITPDTEIASRTWPSGLARARQGRGDLGARMQRLMDQGPPGPRLIVGTDIPDMTPRLLREAFRLLGRADAVLGPAGDGGYWLVGFRRAQRLPRAFQDVRWSSGHALADTVRSLGRTRVAFAATLHDIDDAADLERWRESGARLGF
jgi:hypothetical protein